MSETVNIRELNDLVAGKSNFISLVTQGMDQTIVGQKHLVDSLLIALLSNGHVLLEGVPGLAKTLAIKTLAQVIDAKYSRIQFTPDLLPADVTGTMIYSIQKEQFQIKKGPIFANFVLADEINRAPAKVQSALLEAMQERQVTIGDDTFQLDEPFLVMATQNPIEQEGTYPLPEAQVDRSGAARAALSSSATGTPCRLMMVKNFAKIAKVQLVQLIMLTKEQLVKQLMLM